MKYAIIESGGKQYRAVEGGTLEVDRLPVNVGEIVKLEHVLLLADGENIAVGTPIIKDSPIWTKVVEHFKGEKITIFHYAPKKRIRVKTGHRQNYTRLLVEQIGGSTLVSKPQEKKEPAKVKKAVEAETVTLKAKPAKAKPENEKASAQAKKPAATAATTSAKTTEKAVKTPAKPVTSSKGTSSPQGKKPATAPAKKTTATKASSKKTATKAVSKSAPKTTSSSKGKKPAAK